MRAALAFSVTLALVAQACSQATYSCDYRNGMPITGQSTTQAFCDEYVGLSGNDVTASHDLCVTGYRGIGATGQWSESACPRGGSLGACRIDNNRIDTEWWYPATGSGNISRP